MEQNKILAINCSPRKGNNHLLLDKISKDKCEIINLYDYDIRPCDGCGRCSNLENCKINDQFEELVEKIKRFKKIIIATPVYRLDVPSKVHSFIERTSSLIIHNINFEDKICGIICIGRPGGNGKIHALNILTDFLLSMGAVIIPPVVIGNAHKIGEIEQDPIAELTFNKLVDRLSNASLSFS